MSRFPFFFALIISLPLTAFSAISAHLVGTTATQAILSYVAPDSQPCQVEVSDASGLTPLVHDVDPVLFVGANSDARTGDLMQGTTRIIAIGKRAAEKAADGLFYSRALQTNTVHYYRITCSGGQQATGQFQTMNIPVGNTYNDALPADTANPGNYAYPSVSDTDARQTIIDPATGIKLGRFSLKSVDGNVGNPAYHQEFCSTLFTDPISGASGVFCMKGDADLMFIDAVTGVTKYLGQALPGYWDGRQYVASCYSLGWDNRDPLTWYCYSQQYDFNRSTRYGVALKAHFTGSLVDQPAGTVLDHSMVQYTNLTPAETGHELETYFNAFDPSYANFQSKFGTGYSALQDNRMIFYNREGYSDSKAWVMVFDPGDGTPVGTNASSAHVAGMVTTYGNYPMRYCGLHFNGGWANGNYNGYALINFQFLFGNGSADSTGAGPYLMHITGIQGTSRTTLLATDLYQCPNTNYSSTSDFNCATITVDTAPYNPNPGPGESPWMYDLQVRDNLQSNSPNRLDPSSYGTVISKLSATSFVLKREAPYYDDPDNILLEACASIDDRARPGRSGTDFWDYVNDPHGLNIGGNSIVINQSLNSDHSDYRPNAWVNSGYVVSQGSYPYVSQNGLQYSISAFPTFNGLAGHGFVESHPSIGANIPFFMDGRPYDCGYDSSVGNAVTGQLYHFNSNAYGGTAGSGFSYLYPSILPTQANCGDHVLTDVSGPSSVMPTDASGAYTYCIAKVAGECHAGSVIGDAYINCPGVTYIGCESGGGVGAHYLPTSEVDACLTSGEPYMNDIIQMGLNNGSSYSNGEYGRILSQGFSMYHRENVFSSGYPINDKLALLYTPTGGTGFVPGSSAFSSLDQAFTMVLPPLPLSDGIDRSKFIPLSLSLSPPQGLGATNAIVQYGYAENGPPSSYFCTSRKETCVAVDSKINAAKPILYKQTDAYVGIACTANCQIIIPAVPQRNTYFQVLYRDSDNKVVGQETGIASELSVSSLSGNVVGPNTISNLGANVFDSSATIHWKSSNAADTTMSYGVTPSYGQSTPLVSDLVYDHAVTLAALAGNSRYYFQVRSKDAFNNIAIMNGQPFNTSAASLVNVATLQPRVYPNPWRRGKSGPSITFDQLATNSSIKIFTVSGHLVRSLNAVASSVQWDRTNNAGVEVASGIYLYLITDPTNHVTHGKLAVVR